TSRLARVLLAPLWSGNRNNRRQNMDQSTQQVDVGTLLGAIASVLQQNQANINQTDNAGTHGQRMAQAFQAAAQAASNANTDDAGRQLQVAAQAMKQTGQGKA